MKRNIKLLITLFTFNFLLLTGTHAQGIIQWQNTIGGNIADILYSIQQTSDGGFILGGWSDSGISGDKSENSNGFRDYWIVKTDTIGNIVWQNTIGGDGHDLLYTLRQTSDGGYIFGGFSRSNISGDKTENCMGFADIWIVKTDSLGNIQWENTIGGNDYEELLSIQQTVDGGYIIGSNSSSNISGDKTENCHGVKDYWIVKTDSSGNIQWQNTIGGNDLENLQSIQQTIDGGYIIGGYSKSNISGEKTENNMDPSLSTCDYWILKIDSTGNIQWQNTIGGTNEDFLNCIQQTNDGGYIIGGASRSDISNDKTENCWGLDDYWVVKVDSSGNIQWQNTIGGDYIDFLSSIDQTFDGGYILGGWSDSNISGDKTENSMGPLPARPDYWVIKINASGNIQWQNTIGGFEGEHLYSLQQTSDGGYILGGYSGSIISGDKTEGCFGAYDYWIVKLYPDTVTSISEINPTTNYLQIFPNPAINEITISGYALTNGPTQLKIIDVLGKEVYSRSLTETSFKLQSLNLQSGVYYIHVGNARAKFVKQ